jgi:hypothetical protein
MGETTYLLLDSRSGQPAAPGPALHIYVTESDANWTYRVAEVYLAANLEERTLRGKENGEEVAFFPARTTIQLNY